MSSDATMMLVQFLPTILALVIIVFSILLGLIRGFRKSLILFIQYLISLVVGFIVYFSASVTMLKGELGGILSSISPDFSEANTLYDVAKILLEKFLPDYAAMTANPYIKEVLMIFIGLGVSLALAIVCLVVLPLIIRLILYILYLLFYREGKFKNHRLAEGNDYKPHRILGMVVGAVRGVVSAVLIVTLFTTTFFVLSGGIVESDKEKPENILILDNLSDSVGFDLNALYKGLKASRTTGVGKIFDAILIEGKPIDLYYSDLFLTANINKVEIKEDEVVATNAYLSSDEEAKAEVAKFYLREELSLIVKLLENVLETNAITIVNGEVNVDYDALKVSLDEYVLDYVNGSVLVGEIMPLAIIGVAESIHDGTMVIDKSISELFTDEIIEEIKRLDISKDIAKIISTAFTAVDLIPVNSETQSFDFAAFGDINTYFKFDTEKVKTIFNDLSEIELLTKVVFPAGIGIALNSYGETIEAAGIKPSELKLEGLEWQLEIKNIGEIYEKVVALDLDINALKDTAVNESTGLANNIQYIIDLCNDEELVEGVEKSEIFKTNLVSLIDTVFASDLFSQVGLVFVKSKIAELKIEYEDNTSTPLNDALELVKENLNFYSVEELRSDLSQLASSCLGVTSLIPLFVNNESGKEGINLFEILYSLEVEDIEESLLGTYTLDEDGNRVYDSGLYSLKLLNGSFHENGVYAIDPLIEGALKTYAAEVISTDKVDSITTVGGNKLKPTDIGYDFTAWPNELAALVDAIAELQTVEHLDKINMNAENIADILPPEIGAREIDIITAAASNSILLSGIVEEKLVSVIKNEPSIGYAAKDPNIVWMDTFAVDEDGNTTITRGELNSLLKSFVIYSDDEKGMDFNDTDSLINGLAQLLYTDENGNLDYQDVETFASSQVLMTIISKEISNINTGQGAVSIVVPYSLNTSYEGNEDAWKNWAYDENGDRKNGEFANLVLVLYHAREYELAKNSIAPVSTDTQENIGLTQNNLINAVVYMEEDELVTKSQVLHASLSDAIKGQIGPESIVKVRSGAYDNLPELNPDGNGNYEVIIADEIDKALDVIRIMDLDFTNKDFSQINLQVFLDAINNKGEEARKSICLSNIFNISTFAKIADNSMVKIPEGYLSEDPDKDPYDSDKLYPTNLTDETAWENCELNQILLGIDALGVGATKDHKLDIPTDPVQFLKELDDEEIDVMYDSKVFGFTISWHVFDNVDLIREEEALYEEKVSSEITNNYIHKAEIKRVVEFLKLIDDNNNLKFEEITSSPTLILEKLKDKRVTEDGITKGEKVRELISISNILNINVINVLNDGSLSIPDKFKTDGEVDINIAAWYPTKDTEGNILWEDSEIAKLLNSVVLLEISTQKENGKDVLVVPKAEDLIDDFIKDENKDSEDNSLLSKVYASEVLALTMTTEIKSVSEIHARMIAYVDGEGTAFKLSEIKLLVDFIELTGIQINHDGLDAEHIFGSKVENEDEIPQHVGIIHASNGDKAIAMMVESNILNASMIYNMCGNEINESTFLSFPQSYFEEDSNTKIDPECQYWYGVNGELYHLLTSMKVLEIKASKNTIYFNVEKVIDGLLDIHDEETNETKLDFVYHSDIIAKTISERLLETPTPTEGGHIVEIPNVESIENSNVKEGRSIYDYVEDRIALSDRIIHEIEVENLLRGLRAISVEFAKGFEYDHIFDDISITLLTTANKEDNTKTNLDVVLLSSILQYVISDNLIYQKQTVGDKSYSIVTWNYYKDSNTYTTDYIEKFDNYSEIYITKAEIISVVMGLKEFNVNSIKEVSTNFTSDNLKDYFGKNAEFDKDKLITAVTSSAILSKIFSHILLSNSNMSVATAAVNKPFVTGIEDKTEVESLTQTDLVTILNMASTLL